MFFLILSEKTDSTSQYPTFVVRRPPYHSNKNVVEKAQEMIVNMEIQIGIDQYRSNLIVAECRYHVLLGRPWKVAYCSIVDYNTGKLNNKSVKLPPTPLRMISNCTKYRRENVSSDIA